MKDRVIDMGNAPLFLCQEVVRVHREHGPTYVVFAETTPNVEGGTHRYVSFRLAIPDDAVAPMCRAIMSGDMTECEMPSDIRLAS